MKTRYFYILAAILLACACSEKELETEIDTPQEGGKDAVHTELSAIIDNDADTRTAYTIDDVNKKARFAWAAGDGIDVMVNFNGVFTPVRFITQEAGAEVTFQDGTTAGDETLAGILAKDSGASLSNWAFYPSRSDEAAQNANYGIDWSIKQSGSDEILSVDVPSELTLPVSNPLSIVPLLGRLSGTSTYIFKPMMSVLAIPVTNLPATADFASISCDGAAISGYFQIDQTASAITQGDAVTAEHSLTLNYSGLSGDVTFYFPVPAGTIPAGLTLKVGTKADPESCMTITTKKALNMSQGKITVSPALAFAASDLQWTDVITGTFKDDFIWAQRGWSTSTWIPVTLQRSGLFPERYRIANPYTTAAATFGYTPATSGIATDDYFFFSIDGDNVTFNNFNPGVEDSSNRVLTITYRASQAAYTRIIKAKPDGTPVELQFASYYLIPGDKYTKDTSDDTTIHLKLDYPVTWTKVLDGEFIDEKIWGLQGWGATRVPIELEQSDLSSTDFRVPNPYLIAKTQFGYSTYTSGITGDEYLQFTIQSGDAVRFNTFAAGIEDKASGGYPMKVWYPTDWGSSYSTAGNTVVSYRTDGLPEEIKLVPIYSDVNPSHYSYKYTANSDKPTHLYFTETTTPETWTSIGTGKFWDKLVWSCAGLTDYANVEFQQSNYSGRFRIAKPYPGSGSDEWFVFDVTDPDKVTSDNYYVDYEVTASGKETFKPWVRNGIDYGYNYSDVIQWQANGLPAVVEIGPCYRGSGFDGTTAGYAYEIGRDHESCAVEIVFPGCAPYAVHDNTMKVTPYYNVIEKSYNSGHNSIAKFEFPASGTLQKMVIKISGGDLSKVYGLNLWGSSGWMVSDYVAPNASGVVTMDTFSKPSVSTSAIDLNIKMNGDAIGVYHIDVQEVIVDGVSYGIMQDNTVPYIPGIRLNHGGDVENVRGSSETVASFRIPALVTTNSGALIAAYDVRYANSGDLQGDIDVGMKRSTDGGKTWSSLQLIMDMGTYGSLPENQNGIGDPCLLVDENTGDIFCFAVWTHDHAAGSRALSWAGSGYEIAETPQLMMVRSSDDGLTWSAPVNITRQVKKFDWRMTFQGPGRGITMKDGTLVIPFQHQITDGTLTSGIMYSTDHGLTWHVHNAAHPVTSEAAVAEIEPGVLLLTMRDETNSHARRNYYTTDLGRSWKAHASNGKLIEPTCEASLIHVDASDNSLGKDLLIFSNPHNTSGRSKMTIQISEDKGVTWPHSLLIDSGGSQYSCLTMVDASTVGILYESSRGNILFQAIPLTDIVK